MVGVLVIGWSIEAFFLSFLLELSICFIFLYFNLVTMPKRSGINFAKRLEIVISVIPLGAILGAFIAAQLMILDSFFGFQFTQQINKSNSFFSAMLKLIDENELWFAALFFSCAAIFPLVETRSRIDSFKDLKEYVNKAIASLLFRCGIIMFALIASAMVIFAFVRDNSLDPRLLFVCTVCMKVLIEYKLLKKKKLSY